MKSNGFNRRVKIVCTIGPASNSYEMILALTKAGMNVARLNFSHGTYDDHTKVIQNIRKVSEDLQVPVAILQDLQGPKIRVGKFEKGQIHLEEGARFTLTTKSMLGDEKMASVSYASFPSDVGEGQSILLDDGLLSLQVEEIEKDKVHCQVIKGGVLKNNKGLNIPESSLSVDALTKKDKEDLAFGLANEVDYVALSFVQSYRDILSIKQLITKQHKDVPVIAKIEKPQAVDQIEEIAKYADGIMVARGDLGVEMKVEEVPIIQKKIIRVCNQKGIPVITATQMLESMVQNIRPTRAEASDVANAVMDGTDAVMLSAETASGQYPVETVETMSRIISITEQKHAFPPERQRANPNQLQSVSLAVCHAACQTANIIDARAILCLTLFGNIAKTLARFRPAKPIIAISSNPETIRRLCLIWGVHPLPYYELPGTLRKSLTELNNLLKTKNLLTQGERYVLTTRIPFRQRGFANSFQVYEVE